METPGKIHRATGIRAAGFDFDSNHDRKSGEKIKGRSLEQQTRFEGPDFSGFAIELHRFEKHNQDLTTTSHLAVFMCSDIF